MRDLTLTSGRVCGGCTACCKTHSVESEQLTKPLATWCTHCTEKGCAIYSVRPEPCKDFRCEWIKGMGLDEDRPDKSGFVLDFTANADLPNGQLQIFEFHRGALKSKLARFWIRNALKNNIVVIKVSIRGRMMVEVPKRLRHRFRLG